MTVRAVASHLIFTSVNATPFEGGASASGGAVAAGGNIVLPDVVKTTTNGMCLYCYSGRAAASGYSAWGSGTYTPANYTATGTGPTASPALAEIMVAEARENTLAAPGTITGPTVALTAGHGFSSWAARGVVLKGIGGAAPVFVQRSVYNISDAATPGTLSVGLTGLANNQFSILNFTLDDPTATMTPPDGTWVQAFSQPFAGGVEVRFYKQHPSSGVSAAQTINFGVSVTSGPPVLDGGSSVTVSGTAAVGATLTAVPGAYTPAATSYAYQWTRDGADVGGATGSTYVVPGDGGGHTFRVKVTPSNTAGGAGATTLSSNSIVVPAPPTNTVAPAISRSASPTVVGTSLHVDSTGTWTGSPTLTGEWYRGSSPTGVTATTYPLTSSSDEGATFTYRVSGSNAGGGPVVAVSNAITTDVSEAFGTGSGLTYLSGGTGNTDPTVSIGGARGALYGGGVSALFSAVLGSLAQTGGVRYRLLYDRNGHALTTGADGKLYIKTQFPSGSGLHLAVAVPTEAANTAVAAIDDESTAPTGVTWVTTTNPAAGAAFGDLAPGVYRGVWVRLTVDPGASPTAEADASFAVQFAST